MSQQYKPHTPGSQPNRPDRDRNGVQTFGNRQKAAAEPECPGSMIFDPTTGECLPQDREG